MDGVRGPGNLAADQVYVLTLPGFRWFRANYTSVSPRAQHTCHAATSSQMIIIGGFNPVTVLSWDNTTDPWTQQIGIFDMTALQWKDAYQSNANPYKSPDIVKDFYQQKYVPL